MGLFSKKRSEPLIRPEVRRSILVPAPFDNVVRQLEAFSELASPKHATPQRMLVGRSGGWTVIDLPATLHPSTFHNLGFWLLDTAEGGGGTMLWSDAGRSYPSYALVRDPEIGDCLCGIDAHGAGWTIYVPTNDIVRGEATPATAAVPSTAPPSALATVDILIDDPGSDLNPANDATATSRRNLATLYDFR
jgi:hypothetical protein